jgi:hypothetical protein
MINQNISQNQDSSNETMKRLFETCTVEFIRAEVNVFSPYNIINFTVSFNGPAPEYNSGNHPTC